MSVPPLVAIVDDDPSMRDALEDLVGSLGYRALKFGSADDYLASPDRSGVRCMILDVQMPGMNGLDLQTHLVEARTAPPIIFVTSYGDDTVRRRAIRGGALCVLEKPVQETAIIGCLEAALGER
nr:response regulator [Acuticoccus sp. I52.16.1]